MGQGMDETKSAYEKKYAAGYGVRYPEGHVIRFYERVLRYELQKKPGNMLDFGCGNGVHSVYFESKGYQTYGVDVSERAIQECRGGGLAHPTHFHLIHPGQDITELFTEGFFDLVFANQSLYYLDDENLKKCVDRLYRLTARSGVCFFTMMSSQNVYYQNVVESYDNGLSKVVLRHRLHEETNINFIHSQEELERIFAPFKKLHVGQYEPYGYVDCNDEDGCSHHYMFVGMKD